MVDIDQTNLADHVEKQVELFCQVGVVINATGKLLNGCNFCRWGILMDDGNTIGFSYGKFKILPNGWIQIHIQ